MRGTTVDFSEAPWESSDEPGPGGGDQLRWKLLFSGRRMPTGLMSMGLAEIVAGGVLPMHRHAPAEILSAPGVTAGRRSGLPATW